MIKTLIFDWGGVLTVGRYTPAILKVLSKERPISVEEIYPEFDKLIVQMNEGEISFKKFVHLVNLKFAIKITEKEMEAVFKKAIIPNKEVIALVKKLHGNYNLILMSDNDEVTVKNLKKYHSEMLKLFSKKYFSNEL
ncbi:hypothetical protein KY317_01935, partial [Candidatus Woesearchaeota archaeon]|nr:hypothetical protein [Candidatus Woesearchaeota archaeon]